MLLPAALLGAEKFLGAAVLSAVPIAGGDINDAYRVRLGTGEVLFAKVNETAPPRMFETEARGLEALAALGTQLLIPAVRHVDAQCLILEYVEKGPVDQSEMLGRGLAELHSRHCVVPPGWDCDGYIGTLPQLNRVTGRDDVNWPSFFRDFRLQAQLDLPAAQRLIPRQLRMQLDRVMQRVEDIVHPKTSVCLIHGDLWAGNYMFTARGPTIFDPACYIGAAEVDVAMMKLFGGFSARVFDSYFELRKKEPELERRLLLYQLYPLLVHVNLFGSGYVASLDRTLRPLL